MDRIETASVETSVVNGKAPAKKARKKAPAKKAPVVLSSLLAMREKVCKKYAAQTESASLLRSLPDEQGVKIKTRLEGFHNGSVDAVVDKISTIPGIGDMSTIVSKSLTHNDSAPYAAIGEIFAAARDKGYIAGSATITGA